MNLNWRERLALWICPDGWGILKDATQKAIQAGRQRKATITIFHVHPNCEVCMKGEKNYVAQLPVDLQPGS